jgi:tellurite resistance protein
MRMPLAERSRYLRGLLVLARKDHKIDPRERELIVKLGEMMDFDTRFCEATIDDLLKNEHISDEPVKFSNREHAECFLRDAISLALIDERFDPKELKWIREAARSNGIEEQWLEEAIRHQGENRHQPGPGMLL